MEDHIDGPHDTTDSEASSPAGPAAPPPAQPQPQPAWRLPSGPGAGPWLAGVPASFLVLVALVSLLGLLLLSSIYLVLRLDTIQDRMKTSLPDNLHHSDFLTHWKQLVTSRLGILLFLYNSYERSQPQPMYKIKTNNIAGPHRGSRSTCLTTWSRYPRLAWVSGHCCPSHVDILIRFGTAWKHSQLS